jgi:hypothetical protein
MRRREFVQLVAGATMTWALAAGAQEPPRVPRVGILSDETPSLRTSFAVGVVQGLRDLGYIEGQNIAFGEGTASETAATEFHSIKPSNELALSTPAPALAKRSVGRH